MVIKLKTVLFQNKKRGGKKNKNVSTEPNLKDERSNCN